MIIYPIWVYVKRFFVLCFLNKSNKCKKTDEIEKYGMANIEYFNFSGIIKRYEFNLRGNQNE